MWPSRRALLAGLGAAALSARWPAAAAARDETAHLREVLDRWDTLGTPAARSAALGAFDASALPLPARFDLETARLGCDLDKRLAAAGDGPACYPILVERRFGAPVRIPAARQTLDARIARLQARAQTLLDRMGVTPGPIGTRFAAAFARPRDHYADSGAGRDRAVADMNAWLGAVRSWLPHWFSALPPTCTNVTVRRLTPAEIAAGTGGFRIVPEGKAHGYYVVDLKDIARRPRWTLRSVVHHELLPGHMVQLPIEALTPPHPVRAAYSGGFVEGWATYAEALALRAGMFAHDPESELGAIHWLLFRALRGRADIGLHADGWDEPHTAAWWRAQQGRPIYFVDFDTDIARIAREPGVRLAEALTWLRIEARAQRAPDLRVLHDKILRGGRRPAALLPG